MKKFRSLTLALVALLVLTGCSLPTVKPWHAGSGKIRIVASTDVWGSVANLVAGNSASVSAIIYNVGQDPHSHELTARDQLLINSADIVIMNGGGYDEFMKKAVAADPTPAISIDAFAASGNDHKRNEHIWYDVEQVGSVADAIAKAVERVDSTKSAEVSKQLAAFHQKISLRKAQLTALRATPKKVFLTEPLIAYLVTAAGYQNLTPVAFSRAVEEDRDIPPTVLKQALDLIRSGEVDAIYVNSDTQTAQVNSLLSVNTNVPNFGFSELLMQDPDTYQYTGGYFEMLDGAINELAGK